MEDDSDDYVCPLCVEEMDITDRHFRPCQCGYQICLWCWHQIMESAAKDSGEGRCPACRTAYDKDKIAQSAPKPEDLKDLFDQKSQRAQKAKSHMSASRKHLSNVRVVQRNLAYIVGLPLSVASEEVLERREYFGQYGKITKIAVSRSTAYNAPNGPNGPTASVYVTFVRNEDALKCIQAVDGAVLEGKTLRASFGTTKYCSLWLKHMPCNSPECLYLHDIGVQEDSFTKEEMLANKHQVFHEVTHGASRKATMGLPPPPGDYTSSQAINIPSTSHHHSVGQSSSVGGSPGKTTPLVGSPGRGGLPASSSWGAKGVAGKAVLVAPPRPGSVVPPKPRPAVVSGPGPPPPSVPASGSFAAATLLTPAPAPTPPTAGAAASAAQPQYRPSAAVLSGRVIQASAHPPPIVLPLGSQATTSTSPAVARPDQVRPTWAGSAAAAAAAAAAAMALSGRPTSALSTPESTSPKASEAAKGVLAQPARTLPTISSRPQPQQPRPVSRQVVVAHAAGVSASSASETGLAQPQPAALVKGTSSTGGSTASNSQPLSFAAAASAAGSGEGGMPLGDADDAGSSIWDASRPANASYGPSVAQPSSSLAKTGGNTGVWAAVAAGGATGSNASSSTATALHGSSAGNGPVGGPSSTKPFSFLAAAASGIGKASGGEQDADPGLPRAVSMEALNHLTWAGGGGGKLFRTGSEATLAALNHEDGPSREEGLLHSDSRSGSSEGRWPLAASVSDIDTSPTAMQGRHEGGLRPALLAQVKEEAKSAAEDVHSSSSAVQNSSHAKLRAWGEGEVETGHDTGQLSFAAHHRVAAWGVQRADLTGSSSQNGNLVAGEGTSSGSPSQVLDPRVDGLSTEAAGGSERDMLEGKTGAMFDSRHGGSKDDGLEMGGSLPWHSLSGLSTERLLAVTRDENPLPLDSVPGLASELGVARGGGEGLEGMAACVGRGEGAVRGKELVAKERVIEELEESSLIEGILGLDLDLTGDTLGTPADISKFLLASEGLEGASVSSAFDVKLDPLRSAVREGGKGFLGGDRGSRARQSRFGFARLDDPSDDSSSGKAGVETHDVQLGGTGGGGSQGFSSLFAGLGGSRGVQGPMSTFEGVRTDRTGEAEGGQVEEDWQRCFRALLPDVTITFEKKAQLAESATHAASGGSVHGPEPLTGSPDIPMAMPPPPGFGPVARGPPPGFEGRLGQPPGFSSNQAQQSIGRQSSTSRLPFFEEMAASGDSPSSSPPGSAPSATLGSSEVDFVDPAIMAMGQGKLAQSGQNHIRGYQGHSQATSAARGEQQVDENSLSETLGGLLLGLHEARRAEPPPGMSASHRQHEWESGLRGNLSRHPFQHQQPGIHWRGEEVLGRQHQGHGLPPLGSSYGSGIGDPVSMNAGYQAGNKLVGARGLASNSGTLDRANQQQAFGVPPGHNRNLGPDLGAPSWLGRLSEPFDRSFLDPASHVGASGLDGSMLFARPANQQHPSVFQNMLRGNAPGMAPGIPAGSLMNRAPIVAPDRLRRDWDPSNPSQASMPRPYAPPGFGGLEGGEPHGGYRDEYNSSGVFGHPGPGGGPHAGGGLGPAGGPGQQGQQPMVGMPPPHAMRLREGFFRGNLGGMGNSVGGEMAAVDRTAVAHGGASNSMSGGAPHSNAVFLQAASMEAGGGGVPRDVLLGLGGFEGAAGLRAKASQDNSFAGLGGLKVAEWTEEGEEDGGGEKDAISIEQKKAIRKKEKKLRRDKERMEKEAAAEKLSLRQATGAAAGGVTTADASALQRPKDERAAKAGPTRPAVTVEGSRPAGLEESAAGLANSPPATPPPEGKQQSRQGEAADQEVGDLCSCVARGGGAELAAAEPASLSPLPVPGDPHLYEFVSSLKKRLLEGGLLAGDLDLSLHEVQQMLEASFDNSRELSKLLWEEVALPEDESLAYLMQQPGTEPDSSSLNPTDRVQTLERELQNAREKEKVIESRLMEVKEWIHHDDVLLEGILSEASGSQTSPR